MDWVGRCNCQLQVIASAAKQSSHPSPEFLSSHGSLRNSSLSPKGRGESANLFHPTSQSKKCTAAKIKDFLAVTGENPHPTPLSQAKRRKIPHPNPPRRRGNVLFVKNYLRPVFILIISETHGI